MYECMRGLQRQLMHKTNTIEYSHKRVAFFSLSFLLTCLPISLPTTPQTIIPIKRYILTCGIWAERIVFKSPAAWLTSITYRLFCAAGLVGMEKK